MSKKYIIEIDDEPYMTQNGNVSTALYKAEDFRSLVFDQNGLRKLTPYIADEAYAEGYTLAESKYREAHDEIEQEAYQRGLDDAWDAARKIVLPTDDGGYSYDELKECFGATRGTINASLENTPVTEVIKKIREYEKRKAQDAEIKVGDELAHYLIDKMVIVTHIDRNLVYGVIRNGKLRGVTETITDHKSWIKTGRHVDLTELFGGEEE